MASYTHTGGNLTAGHVHAGRLYGHGDYRGRTHALTGGPARPHEGAEYRSLCGRVVRVGDDGRALTVRPAAEGPAVTCARCLALLAR